MPSHGRYPYLSFRTPRQRPVKYDRTEQKGYSAKRILTIDVSQIPPTHSVVDYIHELWTTGRWHDVVAVDQDRRYFSEQLKQSWMRDQVDPPREAGYLFEVVDHPGYLQYNAWVTNLPVYFYGSAQTSGSAQLPFSMPSILKTFGFKDGWQLMDTFAYRPSASDVEEDLTRVLAASPLKPKVDVPTLDVELVRELSSIGALLRHGVKPFLWPSLTWLIAQFSVKPTLGDLANLVSLPVKMESRISEIARLLAGRSVRRRKVLQNKDDDFGDYTGRLELALGRLRLPVNSTSLTRNRKYYGVASYVLRPFGEKYLRRLLKLYKGSRFQKLKQLDLALSTATHPLAVPTSLWNLLPFSWLVDYFVNVGEFLVATQNAALLDVQGAVSFVQVDKYELRATHGGPVIGTDVRGSVAAYDDWTIRNGRPGRLKVVRRTPVSIEEDLGERIVPSLGVKREIFSAGKLLNIAAVAHVLSSTHRSSRLLRGG